MSPDPLAVVWITTAGRLGLRVRRAPDVFASVDGRGTLTLGTRESLDPDDHVAQMILHEICHWVVAGEHAAGQIDWGFPPMEGLHWRELPTLRLQAWLARRHRLTALLAPTTTARAYWDRLRDPLVPLDDSPDEARIVQATRQSIARSRRAPWQPALDQALQASAALVEITRGVVPAEQLGLLGEPAPAYSMP